MKKAISLFLAFAASFAVLYGCENTPPVVDTTSPRQTEAQATTEPVLGVPVSFDKDNAEAPIVINTNEDGTLYFPQTPTKEGCSFKGWYTEKNGGGELVTVNTKTESEVTYYAKWEDNIDMTNRNRIVIGGFNGITEAEAVEEDFKLLAEFGVDCIFMTYFHSAEDQKTYPSDQCVKWMEKYGIKCWYNDWELNNELKKGTCSVEYIMEMTAPYRDSPSFMGNYLWDEPGSGSFAEIQTAVNTYHKALPNSDMHVNLLPNYAPSSVFVENKYKKYTELFAQMADIRVISQDTYPINISGSKTLKKTLEGNYYKGLNDTATTARDYNRDHWIYIYTMRDTVNAVKNYQPSINEMRFEAFNAMAFGASGICLYSFYTPPSYSKSDSFGFVDDHKKTAMWDDGIQLVKEIKALSEVYPKYLWQNISGYLTDDKNAKYLKRCDGFIEDYSAYIDEIKATQTLTIGLFKEANGSGYACMLSNQHDLNGPKSQEVSVKINNAAKVTAYIGTEAIELQRNTDGYYVFTLQPGQGAFLTVDLY